MRYAPFIAKAIQGLKKGQVSNLAQGPDGYYIVKILDVASNHISMARSCSAGESQKNAL